MSYNYIRGGLYTQSLGGGDDPEETKHTETFEETAVEPETETAAAAAANTETTETAAVKPETETAAVKPETEAAVKPETEAAAKIAADLKKEFSKNSTDLANATMANMQKQINSLRNNTKAPGSTTYIVRDWEPRILNNYALRLFPHRYYWLADEYAARVRWLLRDYYYLSEDEMKSAIRGTVGMLISEEKKKMAPRKKKPRKKKTTKKKKKKPTTKKKKKKKPTTKKKKKKK
jgi:hypothetical protein